MDEKQFRAAMRRAKLFQELNANDVRADFYRGVQRGLRRLYHGENFGHDSEHQKWLSLSPWLNRVGKGIDWNSMQRRIEFGRRRMMGMGYRIGYNYDSLPSPDEVRSVRKLLGWSVWEMAAYCGVSNRTVEGWEQGREISDGPVARLRELLDV